MAKRKNKAKTVVRYRSPKVARRRSRSSPKVSLEAEAMAAAGYGAIREKVSLMLQPFTAKIPLGSVADEAVLGLGGYFLAKKTKNKTLKNIGKAALYIEAARIGEAMADGSAFGRSSSTGASTPGQQNY